MPADAPLPPAERFGRAHPEVELFHTLDPSDGSTAVSEHDAQMFVFELFGQWPRELAHNRRF